jgi:hypothetical protein
MSKGKKIALGVLGVLGLEVAIVLVLAATKPDIIHVERSLVMRGTPADVFPYANDVRKFTKWIPWMDLDPDMKLEYSDPSTGVGAWYTWVGNDDVGAGRMDLLSAEPTKVVHKLSFIEPFVSEADASVIMKPVGDDQVEVTWAFDQKADFGTKIMCVFMDFDTMVGPDFEKGLSRLQKLVEADAQARAGS